MALELEWDDVSPFLPPLPPTQKARVEAWLPVVSLLLDGRYGALITDARRPLFASTAADALERRLSRPTGMIDSQTIGPASVKYNARASIVSWFLPEEIAMLGDAVGMGGGIRSFRTPAPDGIRFGNTNSVLEQIAIGDGIYVEED